METPSQDKKPLKKYKETKKTHDDKLKGQISLIKELLSRIDTLAKLKNDLAALQDRRLSIQEIQELDELSELRNAHEDDLMWLESPGPAQPTSDEELESIAKQMSQAVVWRERTCKDVQKNLEFIEKQITEVDAAINAIEAVEAANY